MDLEERVATLEAKAVPMEIVNRNARAYEEAIDWQTKKLEEYNKIIERQNNLLTSFAQRIEVLERRSALGLAQQIGTGPTSR